MKPLRVFVAVLFLSSCGGGGASPNGATSPGASSARTSVPVTITFAVPRAGQSRVRHAMYVSANSSSISVDVTPSSEPTSTYSGTCTLSSCSVTFASVPGPTTLGIKLSDSGGNILSRSTTAVVVAPSVQNTFALTANPVVASAALQFGATSVTAGTASDVSAAFVARDASGAIVVGADAYVDASGAPVSFTIAPANVQAGGSGTITPTLASPLTASPAAGLTLHYNGAWLDHTDVSIASSSASVTALTGGTITTIPHSDVYTSGLAPGAGIDGAAVGSDGNLWYTDSTFSGMVKMSTNGLGTEYMPSPLAPGWVDGVAATGSDGKIYFIAYNESIGRITVGGTFEALPVVHGSGLTQIVRGADGNIYFTEESGSLGKVTPVGALTEFPLPGASSPRGVGVGPDGNLWVISAFAQTLSRVTPGGVETDSAYTIPWAAGPLIDDNDGVVTGCDGKVWFITPDEQGVGRYDIGAATFSSYRVSGSAHLTDLAVAPDHNVWFLDSFGNLVGRITPGGTVAQFPLGTSGTPYRMTFGPDGNIWTASSAGAIKFVL